MFNTQLPSERRKLFVFILIIFMVVGFGTKYLIVQMGWMGEETEAGTDTRVDQIPTDQSRPTLVYSPDEIKKVQQTVEEFMVVYANQDKAQKDKRLRALKGLTTGTFYQVLKAESENVRQPVERDKFYMESAPQVDCEQEKEHVKCFVVSYWKNQEKQLFERVYACKIVNLASVWLVEEVNIRGSPD